MSLRAPGLQGNLAHEKQPPLPGSLQGPRHSPIVGCQGMLFLMSEVPL